MEFKLPALRRDEIVALKLRTIFEQAGYSLFRMGSFETYDLYMQNKSFLSSDDIITFTGNDGHLMALKPDVTLSIVKNSKTGESRKVYYNESVFRRSRETGEYREINQIGLENIGCNGRNSEAEMLALAAKGLEVIGDFVIDISHMGFIEAVMAQFTCGDSYDEAFAALRDKSPHLMKAAATKAELSPEVTAKMSDLVELSGPFESTLKSARVLSQEVVGAKPALDELEELWEKLKTMDTGKCFRLDFSIINDVDYYNGLIFQGFFKGMAHPILSGGRYDNLLTRFGKSGGAVGFALYLDELERAEDNESFKNPQTDSWLNIALPKGRMGDQVCSILINAKLCDKDLFDESRKLVFEDEDRKIRYYLVKPSDVDSYVEHGTADIGIVGKDTLLENSSDVMELMDLKRGVCRLVVAAKADYKYNPIMPLRVATKYPEIARRYYAQKSQQVEVINLQGSIELAPLTGLSDVIVDIVETGTTLKENNLIVMDEIAPSSARLIANRASWRFKGEQIRRLLAGLEEVV